MTGLQCSARSAAARPRTWLVTAVIGVATTPGLAASVDFSRDIYPILRRSCFECHGPEKQKGGLRLDLRERAMAGGEDGVVIRPKEAAKSEIVRRISLPDGDEDVMPNRGERLTPGAVALLRQWIDEGAVWPDHLEAPKHWAYAKPRRPAVPQVADAGWCQNPIDNFIRAKLVAEKLAPAPEADRRTLVRRLYFALIGLPPTPAQVNEFVNDARADAYERLADRLLALPQFGERWARHWLDLARYADSNGFQRDGFRDVWPYRDWVIDALNRDMPYDQFTIEQLAGDLLPNPTLAQKIATGFNRGSNVNVEAGVDREESRLNQVMDRVSTTATVWLGTTLACAQCHDHKFDPVTQRDYYRFLAYFNNTKIETDFASSTDTARIELVGPYLELPIPELRRQKLEQLRGELAKLDQQLKVFRERYLRADADWENEARETKLYRGVAVPAAILEIIDVTVAQRDSKQIAALADFRLGTHGDVKALIAARDAMRKQVAALEPDRCLVMEELPEPRTTHVLRRGSFLDPAEAVEPGLPAFLGATPAGPPNRLTLARWLVSSENPLIGRVTVNRWWAELFGQGLVSTPEDFGLRGQPPSHPELLDWLAVELVERGWSMKSILRTMVTSATFRQSSVVTEVSLAADPMNVHLERGARFQMDAEMIRDNALAVAGLLSTKMGGPPIRPYQPANVWRAAGKVDNTYMISPGEDAYRRGVYVVWRRSTPYPSFVNFDAPSRTMCVVKRTHSNTPLQALTLLNDPVFVEAAQGFARRIVRESASASSVDQRLQYAVEVCLARPATTTELGALLKLFADTTNRYVAAPDEARRLCGANAPPDPAACVELAGWHAVAAALLNLHETITRE